MRRLLGTLAAIMWLDLWGYGAFLIGVGMGLTIMAVAR